MVCYLVMLCAKIPSMLAVFENIQYSVIFFLFYVILYGALTVIHMLHFNNNFQPVRPLGTDQNFLYPI